MTGLGRQLEGVLEPVRDLAIGRLLQEMAHALERGAWVRQEPPIRDADGYIIRNGGLHLPRRGDLAVTEGGQTLIQFVDSQEELKFEPVTVDRLDGCVAVIAPFRWDAVPVRVEMNGGELDTTPIRRWYLEAFQSRYGDLSPDLDGAVHALVGPRRTGAFCEFQADLGSAPVEAFAEMLEAFVRSGAKRLRIGSEHGVSEKVDRA